MSEHREFFKRVRVASLDECWEWTGAERGLGYGGFYPRGKKGTYAHRWIYEKASGQPIPVWLVIDHVCRNRRCVNPLHLRVVTRKVNCLENSVSASAMNHAKTHCKSGHEFTDANTYLHGGARHCRVCRSEAMRRFHERSAA